jgi:2-keto-4-pentenoate hydratase/2-oxohepta-3-ene-1,7-dioic acid hydratase in catechol pathway
MDPLLPRWDGRAGRFEIWFLVLFDRSRRRAFWLRHTLFAAANGGRPRATVWAALSDADGEPRRIVHKAFEPVAGAVGFPLAACGCRLDREAAEGTAGDLSWSLRFPAAEAPAPRVPHFPEAIPLPTRAWHLLAEAPATGQVTHAGRSLDLDGAVTFMHLEGSRRVDELAWLYAPFLDGNDGAIELTWVRPRLRGPAIWGMWLRAHVATGVSLARRVTQPRPGVMRAVFHRRGRKLVARAWAAPRDFIGYVYRDPAGHDLHVAQCDIASVVVDVYRHGRREARLVRRAAAAMEIHQREPVEGVAYIGWDERDLPPAPAAAAAVANELPAPGAIVALGLTYADHLRETGYDPKKPPPPAVFLKDPRAWLPGGGVVREPGGEEIVEALRALDPARTARIARKLRVPPALLDWEGELAVLVLDEIDDPAPGAPLPIGFAAANDLTARSVQIADGEELAYWAAAKSFPGFLPIAGHVWSPPGGVRDRWPELTIELRVNGVVRQSGRTADLVIEPREALRLARAHVGRPLRRGDVILTGTPAGVALRVPRWKRRLASLLLDDVGRLAAASRGASTGQYLEPGDEVVVDAGEAGRVAVIIEA